MNPSVLVCRYQCTVTVGLYSSVRCTVHLCRHLWSAASPLSTCCQCPGVNMTNSSNSTPSDSHDNTAQEGCSHT